MGRRACLILALALGLTHCLTVNTRDSRVYQQGRLPAAWDGTSDWAKIFPWGFEDSLAEPLMSVGLLYPINVPDSMTWDIAVAVPQYVKRVTVCVADLQKSVTPIDPKGPLCLRGERELIFEKGDSQRSFFLNPVAERFFFCVQDRKQNQHLLKDGSCSVFVNNESLVLKAYDSTDNQTLKRILRFLPNG